MSAFLGPIHHWLYHKIILQDRLTEAFLVFAAEAGMPQVAESVDATYGVMPEGSLEEQIDESNIHGWLQNKIVLVENRYAMAVTEIVNQNSSNLDQLMKIAEQFGKSISPLHPGASAAEAFKVLNDTLIDGMPCDHVNLVVTQEENEVVWKRTQCVHQNFWIENNGDVSNYYQLREKLIQGILAAGNLKFSEFEEGCYRIEK